MPKVHINVVALPTIQQEIQEPPSLLVANSRWQVRSLHTELGVFPVIIDADIPSTVVIACENRSTAHAYVRLREWGLKPLDAADAITRAQSS